MNKDLQGVTDFKQKQGISSYVAGLSKEDSPGLDVKPVKHSSTVGHATNKQSAKKTNPISKFSADQTDKIFDLERDNTNLKAKENLLEGEIVKMRTKLRRIEELLRKKSKGSEMMPHEVENHLQEEIQKLTEENNHIKERAKKLRAIEKELVSGASKPKKAPQSAKKFTNVSGKLGNLQGGLKQSEQDFMKLVEELKVQLVQGEKQLIQLTTHRDNLQLRFSSGGANSNQMEIDAAQRELAEINRRMAEMRSNLIRDETMFSESKTFIERKQSEIQDLNRECENLTHKNFQTNIKAQQAKELSDDLNLIRSERDQIERSIAQITSYPFARNQTGEPSTVQKVAQLELRLEELQRANQKIKQEEQMKWQELGDLRSKVQKIKGESEYIKAQHQEARSKFVAAHGEVNAQSVYRDLAKLDQNAYKDVTNDISVKPESQPIWKDYDFLERGTTPADAGDLKSLKAEIIRMKHENKDFAAELDKAQSLLKLQTDIERENRQYYMQEKERLRLLAQSTQVKAQELAKRADGQDKAIKTLNQKLGLERPTPSASGQAQSYQDLDALSDFSVNSKDSEGRPNENFFDLRVIDANLNEQMLNQFFSKAAGSMYKELMTLVSVDFYDHDTKTSQLTSGFRPQYKSQISFRSEMNSFYIEYLSKNKMKLEIYSAESGKKALLLGSCDVLLSELVYGERFVADSIAQKPAVIEKLLNIVPSPGLAGSRSSQNSDASLGTLRIKMRMRKPIQDAMRFHRDMTDVKNTTRAATGKVDPSAKQLVTIQVAQCKNLSVPYGDASKIAPFFYYQFFTFDERYSQTSAGPNPNFGDSQTYTVQFDDSTLKYFETQTLDIVVFDDNAPVSGIQRGGQSSFGDEPEVDDMIGICKLPMTDLAKGMGITGDYDIKSVKGESRGKVSVKITIVDPNASKKPNAADIKAAEKESFNIGWERDIINRVAKKLARLTIDVELMFGIFSRGTRSCTREDFKYCCLQRLNLKNEISERELDMLLEAKLKNKPNMDQRDFVQVFSQAIASARNEVQNQDAIDRTLMMRYNEAQSAGGRTSGMSSNKMMSKTVEGVSLMDFQRRDAVGVLVSCIHGSSFDQLSKEATRLAKNEKISSDDLRKCLSTIGGISDFDAQKVTNLLSSDGGIFRSKFISLLEEALLDARFNSAAVQKFNTIIQKNTQILTETFVSKDMNNDGQLNLDGFKSAVIGAGELSDYKLNLAELKEIFNLIAMNGIFFYAEYIVEIEPKARQYLGKVSFADESKLAESSITMDHNRSIEHHADIGQLKKTLNPVSSQPVIKTGLNTIRKNNPASAAARAKIEQFMISQDVSLSVLFNVLDTNADKKLSKAEFKQKMRGLHMNLAEEELEGLFTELDTDDDGAITYMAFVESFAAINTAQIIQRMRRILYGASISAEYIYNQHCNSGSMNSAEFKKLVEKLIGKLDEFEVSSIFKELAGSASGQIQKDRFIDWFGRDEQEKLFQIGIEDIIKPLSTYLARKNVQVSELFQSFDKDHNNMLSAQELKQAIKSKLGYDVSPDEVETMKEFFRAKFRRAEIKKTEFQEIMTKQPVRKYESKAAKAALASIKNKLQKSGSTIDQTLSGQRIADMPGEVTLRGFKLSVFSLGCLTQQQVNNLAKYLDRRNNGFILLTDINTALFTDQYSPQGMAKSASGTKF